MKKSIMSAAAIALLSTGTTAFADSHQGCGDGACSVGTGPGRTVFAGHRDEANSTVIVSGLQEGRSTITGNYTNLGEIQATGNCSSDAGSSSTSGEGGGSDGSGCNK